MGDARDRMIVPMYCYGCGAPLEGSLKCQYCRVEHRKVERYAGPEIPDRHHNSVPVYGITSTSSYGTDYLMYNPLYIGIGQYGTR